MATLYRYSAFLHGKRVHEEHRAQSEDEAVLALTRRGYDVYSIRAISESRFNLNRLADVLFGRDRSTRVMFFRGLATLDRVGTEIGTSFALLLRQMDPKSRFAGAARDVLATLASGEHPMLSDALAQHPEVFDPVEVAMIAASERSSDRASALERLATLIERAAKVRKKFIGALLYPSVVGIIGIVFGFVTILGILPLLGTFYANFDIKMPAYFHVLLGISQGLHEPIVDVALAGVLAIVAVALVMWLRTERGAERVDRFTLHDHRFLGINFWPFGEIRRKALASRVLSAYGAMVSSGVDIPVALEAASWVAGSPVVRKALLQARDDVAAGRQTELSAALRLHPDAFEAYSVGFLEIGERAGKVPEMLEHLCGAYDDDVDQLAATLPEKLQLLMILGLGLGVGSLAFIVYDSLSSISSGIHP